MADAAQEQRTLYDRVQRFSSLVLNHFGKLWIFAILSMVVCSSLFGHDSTAITAHFVFVFGPVMFLGFGLPAILRLIDIRQVLIRQERFCPSLFLPLFILLFIGFVLLGTLPWLMVTIQLVAAI